MVMYKTDRRGGGSKNRSLGQTHETEIDSLTEHSAFLEPRERGGG